MSTTTELFTPLDDADLKVVGVCNVWKNAKKLRQTRDRGDPDFTDPFRHCDAAQLTDTVVGFESRPTTQTT